MDFFITVLDLYKNRVESIETTQFSHSFPY